MTQPDTVAAAAVAANALTTLAKAKRHLQLDDGSHDEALVELINHVSRRIEALCLRQFKNATHHEQHRPGLMGYIVLAQYPVTAMVRIADGVNGRILAPRSTALDTGVVRLTERDASRVRPQGVSVEYIAGYEVIPYDIEAVALELVATAYRVGHRDTPITDAQVTRLRPYMAIPAAKVAMEGGD